MVPTQERQPVDGLTVTDESRPVLVRVLRVAFPHAKLPDGPYERTADSVIEAANASTWARLTMLQGISTLDSVSGGAFVDLDDADALKVLRHVDATEFFGLIRRTAVVALYDDPEVWSALGYEGSSYDKGGYIDRGFDDLDWLPEPRIEEYSGPRQLLDVATDLPASPAPATVSPPEGSRSGASLPGVAPQRSQQNQTAETL
jgi:hypothetical protein